MQEAVAAKHHNNGDLKRQDIGRAIEEYLTVLDEAAFGVVALAP